MITPRFDWRSIWVPAGFCWHASRQLPISMLSATASICRRAGRRRPGGLGNRWNDGFSAQAWRHDFEDHFIVLPQIETRRGLENAAGISAHELTTALAIGPYDLSAELGVCGDMDAPVLREALQSLRATADSTGKSTWMIGNDAAQLARDGWRFICIGEPTWILMSALRDKVAQARGALSASTQARLQAASKNLHSNTSSPTSSEVENPCEKASSKKSSAAMNRSSAWPCT